MGGGLNRRSNGLEKWDTCLWLTDVTLGGQEVVFALLWLAVVPVVWSLWNGAQRLGLQMSGAFAALGRPTTQPRPVPDGDATAS